MAEETWTDPIVEEVRRARDAYAAKFNYDLEAIVRDLKKQESNSRRELVTYPPRTSTDPDSSRQGAA